MSFSPVRNTIPNNSKFLPTPQASSANAYRDVLASNKTNSITTAISSGSQRDKIIDAINQARVFTPLAFTATPKQRANETFNIQNFYSMPPEEVKPLLKKVEEEIRSADISNMSNIEAYEWIENKFKEAFGEDFMMGFNLLHCVPANDIWNSEDRIISNYDYVHIGLSFNNMFWNKIGYSEGLQANRERLYGDMSDSEIIDSLMAKYPQPMTNRDLALVSAEIKAVGISDDIGFFRYVDSLIKRPDELPWESTFPSFNEFEERWNMILNQRADIQHLAYLHNDNINDSRPNPHAQTWIMQTKDILVKLGAILGPDGSFLQSDKRIFANLNIKIGESDDSDDVIDELLEIMKQRDIRMKESMERTNRNRELREASGVYESSSDNFHNKVTGTTDYNQ